MMELKTFAVAVYSEADVAEACLTLQDQHQVDVPLLLFCGWYGVYYGQLPAHLLKQAQGISQRLGVHLIKPLRQARRWMKTHSVATDAGQRWDALREEVKRAELHAELLMLDTLACMVAGAAEDAGANFMASLSGQPNQQDVILYNMRLLLNTETTTAQAAQAQTDHRLLGLIGAACLNTAQVKSAQDQQR